MVRHLFSHQGAPDESTADKNQFARMVALLGPPPEALLADLGPRALEFFNEDGSAKGGVPNQMLKLIQEHAIETMTVEELEAFSAFIKWTSTWTEEMRASA